MKTTFKGAKIVASVAGAAVNVGSAAVVTVAKIAFFLVCSAVFLIIFGGLLAFSIIYYYDNSNIVLGKAEQVYRCDVAPVIDVYVNGLLRPLVVGSEMVIDTWNLIARINRAVSLKVIGETVLKADSAKLFIMEFAEGVFSALYQIFKWLFTHPFSYHAPLCKVYDEVIRDTIRLLRDLLCYLCDSLCGIFEMAADILDQTELACAVHNIVNGVYFTALELAKFIIITLWRLFMSIIQAILYGFPQVLVAVGVVQPDILDILDE